MLVSLYSVSWQVANKGGEIEGADANLDALSIPHIFFFLLLT